MSDETARRLAEARSEEAQQSELVVKQKQQYLDAVADQLGDKVDAYGKKVAFEQPEVTKGLGRDGVEAFRRELAAAADRLGAAVRNAADHIKWPTFEYDLAKKRGLRSAVYDYFAAGRTKPINQVVENFGFSLGAYGGISPYGLIDDVDSRALEDGLEVLTRKRKAVEAARDADDQDIVENLWS